MSYTGTGLNPCRTATGCNPLPPPGSLGSVFPRLASSCRYAFGSNATGRSPLAAPYPITRFRFLHTLPAVGVHVACSVTGPGQDASSLAQGPGLLSSARAHR